MGAQGAVKSAMMDDDDQFMVYNRREIAGILRDLAKQRDMISAVFNHGNGMLLTSVVEVDYDREAVYLDLGPDEDNNKNLLSSERTIFVTSAGGVKIQWVSSRISTVKFRGNSTFKIPLPEELQRVQRREYYRLATPILNPLICRIPRGGAQVLRLLLVDISAGGIGANLSEPLDPVFEQGVEFHRCKIDLPGVGEAEVDLRVQGIWEVVLRNGNKSHRAGFSFIHQRAGTPALIQRYMMNLERERHVSADDQ